MEGSVAEMFNFWKEIVDFDQYFLNPVCVEQLIASFKASANISGLSEFVHQFSFKYLSGLILIEHYMVLKSQGQEQAVEDFLVNHIQMFVTRSSLIQFVQEQGDEFNCWVIWCRIFATILVILDPLGLGKCLHNCCIHHGQIRRLT